MTRRGPGRDRGFDSTKFVGSETGPERLPAGMKERSENGKVIRNGKRRKMGSRESKSITSQRVNGVIARDANMTRYPAKTNRLVAGRETEQPVLYVPYHWVDRSERGQKGEGRP